MLLAAADKLHDEAFYADRQSLQAVHDVLTALEKYPLAYRTPVPGKNQAEARWFTDPEPPLSPSPQSFLQSNLAKYSNHAAGQGPWAWETENVLEFARCGDGQHYDPHSLYTILRRFYFVQAAEQDATPRLYRTLSELQGKPEFQQLAAFILRQNHEVTRQCRSCITPARERTNEPEKVDQFLDSEAGHDLMLQKAVESLGYKVETIPVVSSVQGLLGLLAYAAEKNFLAFCCMLPMFERDDYATKDRLATVLEAGGCIAAAKQVQRHKDINGTAGHDDMGWALLASNTNAISATQLTATVHLVEVASRFMNRISFDIETSWQEGVVFAN